MERLLTPFGEKLDKDLPLNDYPRPQLNRHDFYNLNGRWQYAIYDKDEDFKGYQGEIIVPFSPECILSEVEKSVQATDILYYFRKFDFKKEKARAFINFGAVDYRCKVVLNGIVLGEHIGGYFPFSFEITDAVKEGENELCVEVTDPSEKGHQARGKQTTERGGIWYTPQSGIWQTVWIEQTPSVYLKNIKITPDIDSDSVKFCVDVSDEKTNAVINILDKGEVTYTVETVDGNAVVKMNDYDLWSPENPYLYSVEVIVGEDKVESYFGMRKYGIGKDSKGISRLFLNNKPYFHNGLLDQGYWSDGMYTAPSDEALIYDIETMKKMGFNMLRKHIKIEPLRWYYHCDRLGMIVWQDMISGGAGTYNPFAIMIQPAVGLVFCTKKAYTKDTEENYEFFSRTDAAGRDEYYVDSKRMIDTLYNVVSLAVWVPFNEGWGQFDSAKAYEFYKAEDPTRIIDHASGFQDQGCGDLNSFHIYFTAFKFPKFNKNDERPIVLSEFGGYSLQAKGHMYNKDKFFGYRKFYDREKFENAIEKLYLKRVKKAIEKGVSATVYTEVSDVEDECNGLLTYDRKIVKIGVEKMRSINKSIGFSSIE